MEFVPTPGRIVKYKMNQMDADSINKRRQDARDYGAASGNTGFMMHYGNTVMPGDVFPMVIIRVWPADGVNGKVLLDGSDDYWALSKLRGDGDGQWEPYVK